MGIGSTLIGVKLSILIDLVVLCPPTVRGTHASIDASLIVTNRRQGTVLIDRLLTDVHATRVTHTVGLGTTLIGANTEGELLFNTISSLTIGSFDTHPSSRRNHVTTIEVRDTRRRVVHMHKLSVVYVSLVASGVLGQRLSGYDPLSGRLVETIRPVASLGT